MYQGAAQGWSRTGSSPRCSHSGSSQTGCPALLGHFAFHQPSGSLSCRHSTAPSPPATRNKIVFDYLVSQSTVSPEDTVLASHIEL